MVRLNWSMKSCWNNFLLFKSTEQIFAGLLITGSIVTNDDSIYTSVYTLLKFSQFGIYFPHPGFMNFDWIACLVRFCATENVVIRLSCVNILVIMHLQNLHARTGVNQAWRKPSRLCFLYFVPVSVSHFGLLMSEEKVKNYRVFCLLVKCMGCYWIWRTERERIFWFYGANWGVIFTTGTNQDSYFFFCIIEVILPVFGLISNSD